MKIDDDFMQAVETGGLYSQQFPVTGESPLCGKTSTQGALERLLQMPGARQSRVFSFEDTVLRESVPDCYADLGYRTVSTNPCGKFKTFYDSCRFARY